MEDYVFMKRSAEIEKLAAELGFTEVNFLDSEFVILKSKTATEFLKEIGQAKNKKLKTIFKADSEEMLRFVLERTSIDIVYGMETIHPKDSTHFVRGGLDQVLCTIAAEKNKILAISFADILNSQDRKKFLARIKFNVKLCKKYKVQIMLCSFAESGEGMRSAKDFQAFGRILGL